MAVNFPVQERNTSEIRKRKDQLQFPVLLGMTLILQLLLFMVDRITNPDIAIGVGYITVVLFSWLFSKNVHSWVIAIICCFLVLVDYKLTSDSHPDLYILLPNVFISISSITITLILVVMARSQAKDIRQMNDGLEDTVRQRTIELENRISEVRAKNRVINETQLELIAAAKKAKESELRFRNLFEGVPDAIVMVDGNGVIDNVNQKTKDIFGYTANEIAKHKIKKLIPTYKKEVEPIANSIAENEGYTFETICQRRDTTTFEADISLKKLRVNGKLVNSLSIRDISERKATEELLHMQTKSLEVKNKELEQFVYIASHDLQEPLRTISTFTEMLTTEYSDKCDDNAKEMFRHMSDSSERMTNLLVGLLEYGRLGRNAEKADVDCSALLNDVLKDLTVAIKDTNAIIQVEELPTIKGYKNELHVLFQNLISNALKFKKENLVPTIHVGVKRLENKWQFFVRDNGIGIEKRFDKKIFTIFQRLHKREDYKGYGIGLAQVKKIVELHNGEISVSSEPNVGTTFFFTINDIIL